MRSTRRGTVLALVVMLGISGCAARSDIPPAVTSGVVMSMPHFDSVREASVAADAVVLGTITALIATTSDDGGVAGSAGIPMQVYEVRVERGIRGSAAGPTVRLAWLANASDEAAPLAVGQRYLFLADRLTAAQAPGMSNYVPLLVPVGGNQGVLDVDPSAVKATVHGGAPRSLRTGESRSNSWSLATVVSAIA